MLYNKNNDSLLELEQSNLAISFKTQLISKF